MVTPDRARVNHELTSGLTEAARVGVSCVTEEISGKFTLTRLINAHSNASVRELAHSKYI